MRFLLASRSPRRLELLRAIGIDPEVLPADVDEDPRAGERAEQTASRLARTKAQACAARCRDGVVLGADTVVEAGDRLLGKPSSARECREMLDRLAGIEHRVWTAVSLLEGGGGQGAEGIACTRVRFRPLSEAERDWYASTGEGLDKAGGYAIQGRAAVFVESIAGSYSNVVGLPLELLYRLLAQLGLDADYRRQAGG